MNSNNERAKIAESYNNLYSQFSDNTITQVGNYSIVKLIGEGAFGKVYLATHKLTHTKVVLKTGAKNDPNLVREVFYHRQFKHPHITRLYEVVICEGMIWMVLEYCPGKELYDYVLSCGRISVDEVRKLFAQIVSAVYYAHSLNCIHRDLKLENILMDKKGNAKLSDFGFTRECQQRTLLETICGTTVYMAPELIQKLKYDGFKVDIWSLGIILYTMLYGQMPFDDDDEIKNQFKIVNDEPYYNNDVPVEANSLIKKLLSKSPKDRPSCSDILSDPFLDQEGLFQLETSDILLKNLQNSKNFSSKSERHLLKKLKSLGIDVHALQKSVSQMNCDSLCGLWELLLEKQKKKESKKYRTRSTRSVLRVTESASRRVSQFMDTTPQLSRIVSFKSTYTNGNVSTVEKPVEDSQSVVTNPIANNDSSNFSSPEKKKNGFMQKFTKLWKINKKDQDGIPSSSSILHLSNNGSSNNDHNHDHVNNKRTTSENHHYPLNNINSNGNAPVSSTMNGNNSTSTTLVSGHHSNNILQPPLRMILPTKQKDNNKKQLQLAVPSRVQNQENNRTPQLKIREPRSPLRASVSTNSNSKRRNRPISMISQHSFTSQMTTMSDISLDSNTTTQSDIPNRPSFTRKISSDTSLHSRNTTRRSLSLISSNSSASERSSRRNSFYDNSSTDLKFNAISTNRGRRMGEGAVFPRGGFKRRKSPLGGLPPNSKFKRSKPLIIMEEEDSVDDPELDDLEDIETDIDNLHIGESTRKSSDFEDEMSSIGHRSPVSNA